MLHELGIACTVVEKRAGDGTSAMDLMDRGEIDFVINVPREYDQYGRPDGYLIRRHAVESGTPLLTDLQLARAVIEALHRRSEGSLSVRAWQDYLPSDTLNSTNSYR